MNENGAGSRGHCEAWPLDPAADRYGLATTKSGVPGESLSAVRWRRCLVRASVFGTRTHIWQCPVKLPGFGTERSADDFGLCSRLKGKWRACTGTRAGDEHRSGGRHSIQGCRDFVPRSVRPRCHRALREPRVRRRFRAPRSVTPCSTSHARGSPGVPPCRRPSAPPLCRERPR